MPAFPRIADKAGTVGTVVSAASCPACFPALASLGAAAGLGFLSAYESLFVTTLLPLFAGVALLANGLGWFAHRRWLRSALGMLGPALVLLAVLLLGLGGTSPLLYVGLALMVGVSAWDVLSPAHRCRAGRCNKIPS